MNGLLIMVEWLRFRFMMRHRSPSPPPRRGYEGGSRRRSPSPRGGRGGYRGGYGRVDEPSSLLVCNLPRDCRYFWCCACIAVAE